jgi:hypothetical protein
MNSHPKKQLRLAGAPQSTEQPTILVGRIQQVFGDFCEVEIQGVRQTQRAILAHGLPTPCIGQRACICKDVEQDEWLIYALFPSKSADETSIDADLHPALMSFDRQTRTLSLDATRLELKALDAIEISCGAARFRLTMQGAVQILGETITSSAVGEHRIEGASIDLN